jgi:hypothetical protein
VESTLGGLFGTVSSMSWAACSRATSVCFLLGALACGGREKESADASSCGDNGVTRSNASSWVCGDECSRCSCDNGQILRTALTCADAGLTEEAGFDDEPDTGAMFDDDGSCSIVDQRCVDLQPSFNAQMGSGSISGLLVPSCVAMGAARTFVTRRAMRAPRAFPTTCASIRRDRGGEGALPWQQPPVDGSTSRVTDASPSCDIWQS